VLIGALVGCVLAVGLIAVVTTTVIVDDSDGGGRILRADGPFPGPGPGMPLPGPGGGPGGQMMPRMKECLHRQGAGPGAVRPRAFRGCMGVPSLR
jgi:hypothetical protein